LYDTRHKVIDGYGEVPVHSDAITIRHSTDEDRGALRRLAQLDDRPPLHGAALLGFVDGELRAAVPVERGAPLADPFRTTGDVIDLLRLRAAQERRAA
jgi:hypothetical protein